MVTLFHLADLHLDTPFKGLSETNEALAIRLRDATLDALDRAVAFAVERRQQGRLDAVTFGGDIFDEAAPSLRARLRFSQALACLCEEGIPCFVVAGNHDPIDDPLLWHRHVSLPEGCTLFGAEWDVAMLEQNGIPACAVAGRSYGRAMNDGSPLDGLAARAAALASAPLRVGLLHCDAGGTKSEESGYAPVSVADLVDTQLDAWLLGHIHKRPETPYRDRPLITFPGNPQGRDINEAGIKGGLLVRLEPGSAPVTEFVPLGRVLWEHLSVSVAGCANDQEVVAAIRDALALAAGAGHSAGIEGLIARVTLTGRPELEVWRMLRRPETVAEIRQAAAVPAGTPFLVIEQVRVETKPPLPDRHELLSRDDLLSDFLRLVDEARGDPTGEVGEAVRSALAAFTKPAKAFGGIDALGLPIPEVLNAAEEIALSLMWSEEDAVMGEDEALG